MYGIIKPYLVLLLVGTLIAIDPNYFKRYDGFSMVKIISKNEIHIEIIKNLTINNNEKVIIISDEEEVNKPFNILVSPLFKQEFIEICQINKIEYQITIDDIASAMKTQMDFGKKSNLVLNNNYDYSKYQELDTIHNWIDQLVTDYPKMVSKFVVAYSYEGRPLKAIKISTSNKAKPAIWFDGGLHSREWIAPATVVYMTYLFLSQYQKDTTVTTLLDSFDIYVLPVFNVDGYVYTFTNDRLWRKTRRPNNNSECVGTDPNRNWDTHWCEQGSSTEPCSDAYCGSKAFSEIEVKGVADYLSNIKNLVCYINFHAYSQLWMFPYGYTKDEPNKYTALMESSGIAVNALKRLYGTSYNYGSISKIIYPASGSSADWVYDELGVTFSYGVELRDLGEFAFLLPPDQIIPTGLETFEAVKALFLYIKDYLNLPTVENNASQFVLSCYIMALCLTTFDLIYLF